MRSLKGAAAESDFDIAFKSDAGPRRFVAPMDAREVWGSTLFLYVRAKGAPADIIEPVRRVLFSLDLRLPFFNVVTIKDQISASLWQERMLAALVAFLAVAAILLAAAGFYALLAYDTSQGTREFGIRSALGAVEGMSLWSQGVRSGIVGSGAGSDCSDRACGELAASAENHECRSRGGALGRVSSGASAPGAGVGSNAGRDGVVSRGILLVVHFVRKTLTQQQCNTIPRPSVRLVCVNVSPSGICEKRPLRLDRLCSKTIY
jgi:hypothetical protein